MSLFGIYFIIVHLHKYIDKEYIKMTERERLLKSYEDLTPEEIKKTLDYVLALKVQRTHEPGEPLHPKDRQTPHTTF